MHRPAKPSGESYSQNSATGAELMLDQDLWQSVPAYTAAGNFLVKLLAQVYNKNPEAALFASYTDWSDIETTFRSQLMSFTRGLSPFHQVSQASSSRSYWEELCSLPAANLLANLGVILTSIVPNSMAEERSMSTITKLNSLDRASQKVSTLINMTMIRQHYKREENKNNSVCISHTEAHVQFLTVIFRKCRHSARLFGLPISLKSLAA